MVFSFAESARGLEVMRVLRPFRAAMRQRVSTQNDRGNVPAAKQWRLRQFPCVPGPCETR
jgi:hypothetical protein